MMYHKNTNRVSVLILLILLFSFNTNTSAYTNNIDVMVGDTYKYHFIKNSDALFLMNNGTNEILMSEDEIYTLEVIELGSSLKYSFSSDSKPANTITKSGNNTDNSSPIFGDFIITTDWDKWDEIIGEEAQTFQENIDKWDPNIDNNFTLQKTGGITTQNLAESYTKITTIIWDGSIEQFSFTYTKKTGVLEVASFEGFGNNPFQFIIYREDYELPDIERGIKTSTIHLSVILIISTILLVRILLKRKNW